MQPIDVRPDHLEIVREILARYVPEAEIWVFGSRAKWLARDTSDLDLCIRADEPLGFSRMGQLREAFEESNLPYKVDVVDWEAISEGFRKIIERDRVVVQKGRANAISPEPTSKHGGAGWSLMSLGDVITLKRGHDLPSQSRIKGTVPIVSSSGVSDFHAVAKVKGPAVITGRYGTIGQVFYSEEDCWPLNTTLYVEDFKGNDPKFVYFLLKTIDYQKYNDKAAVPGINRNHLHTALVSVPDLAIQREIANTLSSFDDRIFLLSETNATLEAIAQALFKSWFVDFDPVRAKAEGREPEGVPPEIAQLFPSGFEDSELGEIPKGWKAGCLGDVVSILDSKRIPLSGKQRAERQGIYPYYGAASVMDYVDDYLFDGVHVLMGEDGSVANPDGTPILQYVWGKFWANNHAHVLKGKNGVSDEHLLVALKKINITAYMTGAVQAKLNQGNLCRIPFLIPSQTICEVFGKSLEALYGKVRLNSDESSSLSQIRDSLLPRLLSGRMTADEGIFA